MDGKRQRKGDGNGPGYMNGTESGLPEKDEIRAAYRE